jgi:hypothetical protein
MPCSQDDCPETPTWRPVLELRPKADAPATRASFTRLGYCERHKSTAILATFLSDEGFVKIAKYMAENGKPRPASKHCTLAWDPIAKDEAEKLAGAQDRTLTDESLAF